MNARHEGFCDEQIKGFTEQVGVGTYGKEKRRFVIYFCLRWYFFFFLRTLQTLPRLAIEVVHMPMMGTSQNQIK